MAPVLGYWKIRGLVHPIRMVLKYKEVEFVNKTYECGPAPDYNRDGWRNEKFNLGLDLPNLPYYKDGDLKITETMAIIQYLGRKHNLMGSTEEVRVRNDMVHSFSTDCRRSLIRIVFTPDYEKLREEYLKLLPDRMETISKLLGDRKFFAGDEVTISDFCMYDVMDWFRNFDPTCMTQENLKNFMTRFEALPTIKAYMESDEYLRRPFTLRMARWGAEP